MPFAREHSPQWLRLSVANTLKLRGKVLRFFPPRNQPNFFIDSPTRSYPTGYEIANLGPSENRKS
jgi:hypothetical protein